MTEAPGPAAGAPGAGPARATASATSLPASAPTVRRPARYCTPHIRVAGLLALRPEVLAFEPDAEHPHVREFGVDQYEVRLEVRDVLECGAVAMPAEASQGMEREEEEEEVAYFLQLHVRTLDGRRFCKEDTEAAWCVVFQMSRREDLHEAARLLLGSAERGKQPEGGRTRTSVPFACLDCAAQLEARSGRQQREKRHEEGREPRPLREAFASFIWGPSRAPCGGAEEGPGRAPAAQVVLRPEGTSQPLLTQTLAECLVDYLPIGLRLPGAAEWVLRYTPKTHGVSMATLFRNVAECSTTLLVVQDAEARVFGGFAPEPWEPCPGKFCGSGEAFVFSFGRPVGEPELSVYPWTGRNSCFMYADHELLAMGGGEGHHALTVGRDLLRGHSSPTQTFGNPTLASAEEFVVRDIEIWALEEIE